MLGMLQARLAAGGAPPAQEGQEQRRRFGLGCSLRRRADNAAAPRCGGGAALDEQAARKRKLSSSALDFGGFLRRSHLPRPSIGVRAPYWAAAPGGRDAGEVAALIDDVGDARANPLQAVKSLTRLRALICSSSNPCHQEVIDAGGLPVLVERLRDASPVMQFEAAWVLTNIASGSSSQASSLVSAGVVEAALAILASPAIADRPELCDQCLWLLANIAGDENHRLRDWVLLEAGAVGYLGRLFQQLPSFAWSFHSRDQVLRSLTWLMSALCHGRPAPPLEEVDCAFDYFAQVVLEAEDVQMLAEAMWGFCYLLEGAPDDEAACARAGRMLSCGLAAGEQLPRPPARHPLLVKLVQCACVAGEKTNPLAVPALRLIGTLLSAPADATSDMLIAAGALKVLTDVVLDKFAPAQVRLEAAWALSNVAAGTPSQVQHLLDSPGSVAALCDVLESDVPQGLRSESAWALANLARCGPEAVQRLDRRRLLRLTGMALGAGLEPALEPALLEAGRALMGCNGEMVAEAKSCGLWERLEAEEGAKAAPGPPQPKPWACDEDDGADQENRPPQCAALGKDRAAALQLGAAKPCSGLRPSKLKFNA